MNNPRGFVIDRGDGRAQLPGSLHTNRRLSQWVRMSEKGDLQFFTGKAELGQGILSALQLIVAEELELVPSAVTILSASTTRGPDEGVTSGSLSIQDSGSALRHVCAELRGLALARAADKSGLHPEQIRIEDGQFIGPGRQSLGGYGSLLTQNDFEVEYEGHHAPKTAGQRHQLGRTSQPRVDLPDKVFGRPRFIHDLRFAGMLHGRVIRPPLLNARLNDGATETLATLKKDHPNLQLWIDGRFIAVIAKRERDAVAGATAVSQRLTWHTEGSLPDISALPTFLRSAPHEVTVTARSGQFSNAPQSANSDLPTDGRWFSAEYFKPYLAHGSIGPSCAIAHWDGQRMEVWTHSQGIHNLRDDLVLALALESPAVTRDAITIHHVEGAGCYGHNGADDVALDAALMALRCPGHPVRVLWSRAAELTHSPLGSAQLIDLQARVDVSGNITHWRHHLWAHGYSSRPGRAKTPSLLAASERSKSTTLPLPINPPLAAGGGAERNAVPAYRLPHLEVITHRLTVMALRTSAMRALGGYANVFAIESFIDEIALALKEDPLAFRRRHLDDPRARAVLDTVVDRSLWWNRHNVHNEEGIGRGLAWARYKNTGAWCAVIARVSVTNVVRVTNLDLAVDVGTVIDLDGVINQIEGGAIQSTSWTLKEQMQFTRDRLISDGWEHYPILRFSEVPQVNVHVLDRPDEPSLGAGEAAQGPVAAAIANAVANGLGVRVRTLPLSSDNLLQAIQAA